MTKIEIIRRVKVLMEELTPFDDGLIVLNSDVKPIESYIEEMLQPSCNKMLKTCPIHLTTPKALPTSRLIGRTDNNRVIGTLTLPADFIRLHTFKMKLWERPIHRLISVENPDYILQQNPFTRGGNAKPVMVNKSGTIEIYTYSVGDRVDTALYIPRVDMDEQYIELSDRLMDALCYLTASEVYAIFGNPLSDKLNAQYETVLKLEL